MRRQEAKAITSHNRRICRRRNEPNLGINIHPFEDFVRSGHIEKIDLIVDGNADDHGAPRLNRLDRVTMGVAGTNAASHLGRRGARLLSNIRNKVIANMTAQWSGPLIMIVHSINAQQAPTHQRA